MLQRLARLWLDPARVTWLPYASCAAVLIWILLPRDEAIHAWASGLELPRWLEREAAFARGGGGVAAVVLIGLAVWLLDPAKRRRLVDGAFALAATGAASVGLKILLARPRPVLDEPELFLGPLGAYPLGPEIGFRASWQFWDPHAWVLWSMPASGAAYLGALGAFVGVVYPRLRAAAALLVALGVGAMLLSPAHYATDVIAGAALGLAVGHTSVRFSWGCRLLGWASDTGADGQPYNAATAGERSGENERGTITAAGPAGRG